MIRKSQSKKRRSARTSEAMRFFVVQRNERAAIIKWARNNIEAIRRSGLQDAIAVMLPLHSKMKTDVLFDAKKIQRMKIKRESQLLGWTYLGTNPKRKGKANVR